jgi:FkbM family methyltransferase
MNEIDFMREEELHFMDIIKKEYVSINYVDVGANIGGFSINVTNNVDVNKAYLFEPIKSCYDKLCKKFNNPKFEIHNIAVGSEKSITHINECINKEDHSSIVNRDWLYSKPEYNIKKTQVVIDKLDNIIKEDINILKIDTEGYELEVLKGCKKLLSKGKIDYIQFEYGGCFKDFNIKLNDVIDFLSYYGYKVYELKNKKFIQVTNYVDDYRWVNFYSKKAD